MEARSKIASIAESAKPALMSPSSMFLIAQIARPASRKRKVSPDTPPPFSKPGRLFACPYSKAYADNRDLCSVCLKGWPTFRRLKYVGDFYATSAPLDQRLTVALSREHVLRKHRSLEPRERCKPNTRDDTDDLDPRYRLNRKQECALSSRSKRMADVDKWTSLYNLLFPGKELPSPCMLATHSLVSVVTKPKLHPVVEQDAVNDALDTLLQFLREPGKLVYDRKLIVGILEQNGKLDELVFDILKNVVQGFVVRGVKTLCLRQNHPCPTPIGQSRE